ncbi:hypothetical protein C8J57DRAFT_1221222 [Mycena rebaudengoi]|nr:hypothetical protein C8J57DRAFT_1221222 [Mycena rebaudengoi]
MSLRARRSPTRLTEDVNFTSRLPNVFRGTSLVRQSAAPFVVPGCVWERASANATRDKGCTASECGPLAIAQPSAQTRKLSRMSVVDESAPQKADLWDEEARRFARSAARARMSDLDAQIRDLERSLAAARLERQEVFEAHLATYKYPILTLLTD